MVKKKLLKSYSHVSPSKFAQSSMDIKKPQCLKLRLAYVCAEAACIQVGYYFEKSARTEHSDRNSIVQHQIYADTDGLLFIRIILQLVIKFSLHVEWRKVGSPFNKSNKTLCIFHYKLKYYIVSELNQVNYIREHCIHINVYNYTIKTFSNAFVITQRQL